MTLDSILTLLRGPRRAAAEYRQAASSIDLKVYGATVEAHQAKRDALLLRGSEAEIEAMEAQVRAAQREADRARIALAELDRLTGEAEERERQAEIERTAQRARETRDRTLSLYVELDVAATKVAELLAQLAENDEAIRMANRILIDAGRRDLKVGSALGMLAEYMGIASGPQGLPHVHEWALHGYWPSQSRHPDGRRLGRAAELLKPGRKAAT